MKITRRQSIALAGTAAAAMIVGEPSRATAALAYDVVVYTAPGSGTPTVTLAGSVPAVSVSVFVYAADGSLLATQTDLVLVSGTATNGWWRSGQRAQVPFGVYDLAVEITADTGEIYRQTIPLGFVDLLTTRVENLALSPARIDADHRSVTVSGDLIATDPRTQADFPFAGEYMYISVSYPPTVSVAQPQPEVRATTDAQGHFSAVIEPGAAVTVHANFNNRYPRAEASYTTIDLPAAVRPVRMSLEPDRTTAIDGEDITLSGRLEWQVAGQWQPYAGRQVRLDWYENGETPEDTTDADGRFAFTVLAYPQAYTAYFNTWYPVDNLVGAARASTAEITMRYPVEITSFSVESRGPDKWRCSGRLDYPGLASRGASSVNLQTSPVATIAWKTVKTVVVPGGEGWFEADLTMPGGQILLRAQIDGDDIFLEGVSDSIYILQLAPTPLLHPPVQEPSQPRLR